MKYRSLGRSGLKVSELALGSWTTYGGYVDDAEAVRIVRRAFELGINLFDTADVYVRGGAETLLGKAITGLPREQLVIATKVMGRVWDGPLGAGLSRKHIFDAMDQSLRRLGVDYVDLYQAHAPHPESPIEETLRAFEDLVRMGKARYVGFSNFDRDPALAEKVIEIQNGRGWDAMVSSQPRYSLLDRHIEPEHIAFCRTHGIGMLVYSPVAQGVLTGKYAGGATPEGSRATSKFANFLTQEKALTPENVAAADRFAAWVKSRGLPGPAAVAVAWVLREPQVSSAILGASRVEQLEENVKASELELGAADWSEAEAAIAGAPAGRARAASEATRPAGPAAPRRRGSPG
ncbi:MAG TPA: aldo/keto reductase [Candidatus Eisenbacteria bacterium]|jgi:aryl-alcohol dehydrogenase-like predicted oxidoreductase